MNEEDKRENVRKKILEQTVEKLKITKSNAQQKTDKKSKSNKKYSSIAIDLNLVEELNLYCDQCDITKKDFVRLALCFLKKGNIDIKNPPDLNHNKTLVDTFGEFLNIVRADEKKDTDRLLKRIDDVIKIQKSQEKDYFKVISKDSTETNEHVKDIVRDINKKRGSK